jgi:hypothetical protein
MRKTALKLIEVIHVGKKLADDQDCPAIGKNLRRTCDRAILAIKVHAATLTQADGAMSPVFGPVFVSERPILPWLTV